MQHVATLPSIGALSRATKVPTETLRTWETEPPIAINAWFEHVLRFDGAALDRELQSSWAAHAGLTFVDRCAAPFVREIGRRWARGDLEVAQEHFASERLQEFLVQLWRPLSDASAGATFVCATLPGEQHVLGLHMAALTLALGAGRIILLGANLPPTDVAMAALQTRGDAVVLSASSVVDSERLVADTATLRAALASHTPVVAGGTGFLRTRPAGVTVFASFGDLQRWQQAQSAS